MDGRRREVEAFDVYGPKAVAGIGDLPATVADRSIPIRLKRRAPSERQPPPADRRSGGSRLRCWSTVTGTLVTDVTVPQELPECRDSWEPLLARRAAGVVAIPCRLAAVALSAKDVLP
jgi:hypothetical protein